MAPKGRSSTAATTTTSKSSPILIKAEITRLTREMPTPTTPLPSTTPTTSTSSTTSTTSTTTTPLSSTEILQRNYDQRVSQLTEIERIYVVKDCCIPLSAGWGTLGAFAFVVLLILCCCLYGIMWIREREKENGKAAIRRFNDDYRLQLKKQREKQTSAFAGSPAALSCPPYLEAKGNAFGGIYQSAVGRSTPIETSGKSVAAIVNFLAKYPVESDVIYRPTRTDFLLTSTAHPKSAEVANPNPELLMNSSRIAKDPIKPSELPRLPEDGTGDPRFASPAPSPIIHPNEQSHDKHNSSAPRKLANSLRQMKKKFSRKKRTRTYSQEEAVAAPPPKPNSRRSTDRVVFQDGRHQKV